MTEKYYCEKCNGEHDGSFGSGRFCCRSCANSRIQTPETKKKIAKGVCETQGFSGPREDYTTKLCYYCQENPIGKGARWFCSFQCRDNYWYEDYIQKWKNGEVNGMAGEGVSGYVRRYLFEKNNNQCEECGWGKENPHTGNIPLTIHHIDGDHRNQNEDNLQLLCPNCHALTETYGGRNKGNGREQRTAWRVAMREKAKEEIE